MHGKVLRIVGFAAMGAILFGIDCGNTGAAQVKPGFIKHFCGDREWSDDSWPKHATCHPSNPATCDVLLDCSSLLTEPAGYTSFKTYMTSLVCLGSALGALLLAPAAAKIGRRECMFMGSLLAVISIIPQVFIHNYAVFLIMRFLLGVGVGLICFALPVFISEVAPTSIRGALTASFQLVLQAGNTAAMLILSFDGVSYEIAFAMPAVPGLILCLGIFTLPASPRELLVKALKPGITDDKRNKYLSQASESMRKLRDSDEEADAEFQQLKQDLASQTDPAPWSKLWQDKSIWRRVLVANMLQWMQQLSGENCLLQYGPQILDGVNVPLSGLSVTAIGNIFNLAATAIMMAMIDNWGRRPLFQFTTVGMSGSMLVAGLFALGTATTFKGWMIVIMMWLAPFAFGLGYGGGAWVYPTELFPMDVKDKAMATSVFSQYFANFLMNRYSAYLPKLFGNYAGTFFFFSGCNVIGFVLCGMMVKETKGKSLEEVGVLFGAEKNLLEDVERTRN